MDKNLDNDEKFYRLPKRLFTEEQFQNMTGAAKLLYMILLDRRCLSELNGDAWRDEYGVVFIFFTIEEIMKLMHLGNKKINKMLKDVGRILRTFKIKKNVEVTDNGKIII